MKICDFYLLFRLNTEIKVSILNSIKKLNWLCTKQITELTDFVIYPWIYSKCLNCYYYTILNNVERIVGYVYADVCFIVGKSNLF